MYVICGSTYSAVIQRLFRLPSLDRRRNHHGCCFYGRLSPLASKRPTRTQLLEQCVLKTSFALIKARAIISYCNGLWAKLEPLPLTFSILPSHSLQHQRIQNNFRIRWIISSTIIFGQCKTRSVSPQLSFLIRLPGLQSLIFDRDQRS